MKKCMNTLTVKNINNSAKLQVDYSSCLKYKIIKFLTKIITFL